MRKNLNRFEWRALYLAVSTLLLLVWGTNAYAQKQTPKAKLVNASAAEVQDPLYREYRGIQLGMTRTEARAKLGEPVMKADDQDFYVLSPNETTQVVYDTEGKVKTISTDYTGGTGAPDYRTVVGTGLLEKPDGSMYRMVRHNGEGFWVSYNKSAGAVPVVTITLQVQ